MLFKVSSMANDGCQLPAWTGHAFAYLPHHPKGNALASQSYAQQRPQGEYAAPWRLVLLLLHAHCTAVAAKPLLVGAQATQSMSAAVPAATLREVTPA